MWNDLQLVFSFMLNTLSGVANVVMNSILILVAGLFVIRLVVKLFKRLVG